MSDSGTHPILSELEWEEILRISVVHIERLRAHDEALRERVAVLTEERDEANGVIHETRQVARRILRERAEAERHVAALEAGLRDYGWHAPRCSWTRGDAQATKPRVCTCGFDEVIATLGGVPAAAPDREAEEIVAFPHRQLYEGRFPEPERCPRCGRTHAEYAQRDPSNIKWNPCTSGWHACPLCGSTDRAEMLRPCSSPTWTPNAWHDGETPE